MQLTQSSSKAGSWDDFFQAIPDGVLILTDEGTIQGANEAAAKLLEARDAGLLKGTQLSDWVVPASTEGTGDAALREMKARAGGRWLEMVSAPAGSGVENSRDRVVVLRDITRRKREMEQRLQAEKMDSIGRLSGTIAHNFNNLLTVITSYAGLARDSLVPADPVRRFVEEISKATNRAVDVTRQLSMFSRQQAAAPQVFCLNETVVSLADMLKPLIGDRVALSLQTSPGRALVRANSGLWEQALVNLAMNARDAMPDGGCLTISTVRVEIGMEEASRRGDLLAGSYIRLEVRDSGTGMAPEVKQHLFEPFFTTKGCGKGLGLGLVTVYGTVQQSGGSIDVQSEPGKGTSISMLLPRAEQIDDRPVGDWTGSGKPAAEPVALRVFDGHAIANETVLVVDDEPELRELAAMTLRNQGYTVLEAANGEEALLVSRGHDGNPIHLLLTDAIMPQMGGQQLLKRLQQDHPDLRSLFISGYTNESLVWQGELAGAVEFLQKPFTPKGLLRRVREILEADI